MPSQLSPAAEITMEQELEELYAHGNEHIERLRTGCSPRVFILSGPSGVGKDSVLADLQAFYPAARYVVTSTSRRIREGKETEGVHYNFMDRAELQRRIDAGEYIESEDVYGNLYGVPRKPILEGLAAGRDVVIKVDVRGARTLRKKIRPVSSIFLCPESMEELYRRLAARNTEDEEALMQRFRKASEELGTSVEFNYLVFNEAGRMGRAVEEICHIIEAEKRRMDQPGVWVSPD